MLSLECSDERYRRASQAFSWVSISAGHSVPEEMLRSEKKHSTPNISRDWTSCAATSWSSEAWLTNSLRPRRPTASSGMRLLTLTT